MARILHIDCNQADQELVKAALAPVGHEVYAAQSGIEGVRMAEAQPPDLVLVDAQLPDLDGYEVTLRIRGIPALDKVPVVMLAAASNERSAFAVGADGLIHKPLDAAGLSGLVAPHLRPRTKPRRQAAQTLQQHTQQIVRHLEEKVLELSETNRRMQDMARLRRDFLRNITHELATPLTPVIGYLGLLLEGQLGPLSPLQQKSLMSMSASAERLRFLIDTLLDMSLLESGSIHFYERHYDFANVVHQALDLIASRAAEADVKIIHAVPADAAPATGDPDKLRRAMVHVLDNAVKFTPRGGKVALEASSEMDASQQTLYTVHVADSGSGIDATQLEHIFEPFYQVDGSPTRSYGGAGLGLAFARRVSRALGGDVSVQSPPGHSVAKHLLKGTLVSLKVSARPSLKTSP